MPGFEPGLATPKAAVLDQATLHPPKKLETKKFYKHIDKNKKIRFLTCKIQKSSPKQEDKIQD